MDGIWYVHGHNGCQIQGRGIPISGKPPWKFPEFPGIPNASPGIPGIRAGTGDWSYSCFLRDLAYFRTYCLLATYRSITQRLGTWIHATQPQQRHISELHRLSLGLELYP